MSLATFLRDEGRSGEGYAVLEPVLAGFGEGWATPDLIAARELADTID